MLVSVPGTSSAHNAALVPDTQSLAMQTIPPVSIATKSKRTGTFYAIYLFLIYFNLLLHILLSIYIAMQIFSLYYYFSPCCSPTTCCNSSYAGFSVNILLCKFFTLYYYFSPCYSPTTCCNFSYANFSVYILLCKFLLFIIIFLPAALQLHVVIFFPLFRFKLRPF